MHLAVSAAGSLVCGVQLCPLVLHGIGAVLLLCFRCGCLLKRRFAFCCRHLSCCRLFLQYWQVEPDTYPSYYFHLSGVSIVLLPHSHLWRQLLPPVAQSAWCQASQSSIGDYPPMLADSMHVVLYIRLADGFKAPPVTLAGHLSSRIGCCKTAVQARSSPIELCSHVVYACLLSGCGSGLRGNFSGMIVCAKCFFK